MGLMFPFIDKTYNPVAILPCEYLCTYCWAEDLKSNKLRDAKRYVDLKEHHQSHSIVEHELLRKFPAGYFVFVEDMGDLFAPSIPSSIIQRVLDNLQKNVRYLFLTKNPARYKEFLPSLDKLDAVIGITAETNRSTKQFSQAPSPEERFEAFRDIESICPKFVSIEPIMDFNINDFENEIYNIPNLWGVAVGYDNYPEKHHLPEPELSKTQQLIHDIEEYMTVYKKTLREAKRW